MKSYGPKPEEEPSKIAILEGFIIAALVTEWVKHHSSLNTGWYWIIAIGTFFLFVSAFMASSITRFAAMVVVTPFIVFLAYGLGTSMVGYPLGFVLGYFALQLSIALHVAMKDENESNKIFAKIRPFATGLYIVVVCIAGAWYHFHPPQDPPSTATPANVSPDDDTSQ